MIKEEYIYEVGDSVMCTRNEYTFKDENNWCIWKGFSYVVDGVSYNSFGGQEIRLRGVGNSNYSPMYPSIWFNIVNTVTKNFKNMTTHELESTVKILEDFKEVLDNYVAPPNENGWSLSNLPTHMWESLGESIDNIKSYIKQNKDE